MIPLSNTLEKSNKVCRIGGMAKRKFQLSEQAINELQSAYQHSRQGQERTRFQAVRLYGQGYSVAESKRPVVVPPQL